MWICVKGPFIGDALCCYCPIVFMRLWDAGTESLDLAGEIILFKKKYNDVHHFMYGEMSPLCLCMERHAHYFGAWSDESTPWGLCVNDLDHHCVRYIIVACSVPSYYIIQWRIIANWTIIQYLTENMYMKLSSGTCRSGTNVFTIRVPIPYMYVTGI